MILTLSWVGMCWIIPFIHTAAITGPYTTRALCITKMGRNPPCYWMYGEKWTPSLGSELKKTLFFFRFGLSPSLSLTPLTYLDGTVHSAYCEEVKPWMRWDPRWTSSRGPCSWAAKGRRGRRQPVGRWWPPLISDQSSSVKSCSANLPQYSPGSHELRGERAQEHSDSSLPYWHIALHLKLGAFSVSLLGIQASDCQTVRKRSSSFRGCLIVWFLLIVSSLCFSPNAIRGTRWELVQIDTNG